MAWRVIWEGVAALGSLGVPRGLAWLTAMFGRDKYSDRAMRLLRRPPVESAVHLEGASDFLLHGTPGGAEETEDSDPSQTVNPGGAEKAELMG
jgi:hypothetical protein